MDDTPANQTPGEDFNKLDLSALQAFQFGTQWTDAGTKKPSGGSSHGSPREGESGAPRRDRRPPRRPSEGGEGFRGGERSDAPREDIQGGARPPRERFGGPREGGPRRPFPPREGGGERGPRPEGGDRFGGRPRFERGGPGREGGERGDFGPRRPSGPPRPYLSPVFEITFYPDDTGFNALVKAMRSSCRTYELFEIARLILGKVERCVLVFKRRPETPGGSSGPVYLSVPDGVPFPSEEEAINHALERMMDQFFTTEVVEVEPPKGSFQFVSRCPITKDLLAPANYHRYAQIVQHHYNARGIRMPFDKYKAALEVVRDPEAVTQWLESMKKVTRYTYKLAPEGEPAVFDNIEDARAHVLRTARDRIVRAAETARVAAKAVESVGGSEAFRAMHGALEMQRRFPLDTANALRGRLRRENFHIFKRGSKGITYVCSVRRKFRQPGQTFSDSINALIAFLDANPLVNVAELPLKFLGFAPPAAPAPATPAAPVEGAPAESSESTPVPAEAAPAPAVAELGADQKATLNRLVLDLRWLVAEGYVAEYSDGRLFAHPVLAQGQTEPTEEKDHEPSSAGGEAAPAEASAGNEPAAETPASEAAPAAEVETPSAVEPAAEPAAEAPTEPKPEA
ncbi:MAG: hypothetical protein IAE82_08215 [Opitutaceae bacterium]|nr:hypothetical protein [Opitutaceae bacterium]